MAASFLRFLLWLVAVALILITGWNQPLRDRFRSQADIDAERQAMMPTPVPQAAPQRWIPQSDTLSTKPSGRH